MNFEIRQKKKKTTPTRSQPTSFLASWQKTFHKGTLKKGVFVLATHSNINPGIGEQNVVYHDLGEITVYYYSTTIYPVREKNQTHLN
jgi:hypothetical protein